MNKVKAIDDDAGRTKVLTFDTEAEANAFVRGVEWCKHPSIMAHRMPDEPENTNCLEGMRCPECGSLGPFVLSGTAVFIVSDDGCSEFEAVQWEDGDHASCQRCEWQGMVSDLRKPKGQECPCGEAIDASVCANCESDIPADHPVQPILTEADRDNATGLMTCGICGRQWDDDIITCMTPVPSARCPFEYFH